MSVIWGGAGGVITVGLLHAVRIRGALYAAKSFRRRGRDLDLPPVDLSQYTVRDLGE